MREAIKIQKGEYLPKNAVVLGVSLNGAGIRVHLGTGPRTVHDLTLPTRPDIAADLCRIMEVDELCRVGNSGERVYVRALGFAVWSEGIFGIAHLLDDFGLSAMDYYKNGRSNDGMIEPEEPPPHGEESLFYMSTLDPPPGLPWTLHKPPLGGVAPSWFELQGEGNMAIGHVDGPMAEWLVNNAKLAEFKE